MGVTDVESEFKRLGPYVLLRASGAGGMARIDLALRGGPETAKVCVLKRLHADYRSPEQEARFRREAAIARRLSHDAIARTLDIDEIDGELLLLQELVMGVDLRRLTARVVAVGERLPVPLAVYIVSEVARALHYAHTFRKLGIVHRDVTPDNIMLAFSGAVKLVDFGIARSNADATLTQAGFVVGRPIYTAPEVWEGARADRRSDIYSLGVVLWQLLAGRPLEPADTESSPSQINPDVPPELSAVNLRAFDADPAHRYQSAGALHQALTPYLPRGFSAAAQLSELLARHFDVAREQQMLAEDVAHARPLLATVEASGSASQPLEVATRRKNKPLLIAAASLLLFNVALISVTHRPPRFAVTHSAPRTPQMSPATSTPHAAIAKTDPVAMMPGPTIPVATAPTATISVPNAQATTADSRRESSMRQGGGLGHEKDRPRFAVFPAHVAAPPADTRKMLAEAQDNFDRGDLAAALASAREAAHRGAGGPAYILIGTIAMNGRRYDEAERAFSEATRLAPEDVRAARLLEMVREIRKMGSAPP